MLPLRGTAPSELLTACDPFTASLEGSSPIIAV